MPRFGLGHLDLVDRTALVVDLDLVLARLAAQLGLEHLLDAGLADRVARQVAVALVRCQLVAVDLPDVPEDVGRLVVVRVRALGRAADRHLGELRTVLGHVDGLGPVDVLRHRHRLERVVVGVVDELVDVVGGDGLLRRAQESTEAHLQLLAFGRRQVLAVDHQRRDRHGLRQHCAVAVVDRPAHRGHGHRPVALALRGDRELLAPGDLQEPEPGEQAGEQREDQHPHDGEPAGAVRLGHAVSQSRGRARRTGRHRIRQLVGASSRRAARLTSGNTIGAITAS